VHRHEEVRRAAETAATEFSDYLRKIAEPQNPSLVDAAVDDMIRYGAPLQLFERTATEDVEIADFRVTKGDKTVAAVRALLEQAPKLHTAREPERRPEFVIRGLRSFPVSA
jgi:cytochrome P450